MMVGRHKDVHPVRIDPHRPRRRSRHGGGRVARFRLQQDLGVDIQFCELVQDGVTMRHAADDNQPPRFTGKGRNTQGGFLEQRPVARQGHELLGT